MDRIMRDNIWVRPCVTKSLFIGSPGGLPERAYLKRKYKYIYKKKGEIRKRKWATSLSINNSYTTQSTHCCVRREHLSLAGSRCWRTYRMGIIIIRDTHTHTHTVLLSFQSRKLCSICGIKGGREKRG